MATPRRKWFKVADSILREDLTPIGRSTFLGLLAWFNQRRARDGISAGEARAANIPPGDLLTITLADSLDDARTRINEISARFELTVTARERFTFVDWPNLPEFQEWERPESGQSAGKARATESPRSARSTPLPSPTPKPSPKPNREEPRRPRRVLSECPESLSSEQNEALRAWCLAKHPTLLRELPEIWDELVSWARANGHRKADWYAQMQTFVRRRAERTTAGPPVLPPYRNGQPSTRPVSTITNADRYAKKEIPVA